MYVNKGQIYYETNIFLNTYYYILDYKRDKGRTRTKNICFVAVIHPKNRQTDTSQYILHKREDKIKEKEKKKYTKGVKVRINF